MLWDSLWPHALGLSVALRALGLYVAACCGSLCGIACTGWYMCEASCPGVGALMRVPLSVQAGEQSAAALRREGEQQEAARQLQEQLALVEVEAEATARKMHDQLTQVGEGGCLRPAGAGCGGGVSKTSWCRWERGCG